MCVCISAESDLFGPSGRRDQILQSSAQVEMFDEKIDHNVVEASQNSYADLDDENIEFHYKDKIFQYRLADNIKTSKKFDIDFAINRYGRFDSAETRRRLLAHMLDIGIDESVAINYLFPNLDTLVTKIKKTIERAPLDAKQTINTNTEKVFFITPEQVGIRLDETSLYHEIATTYLNCDMLLIDLPTRELIPNIRARDYQKRAYLRADFSTDISRSNADRKHNVKTALASLNRLEIAPNETFSFNKITGRRTKANGYREAKIIINNEYVNGVGGGVCQVSTTLYNSALLAGLEILEANKHSKQVGYVKYGFEHITDPMLELMFAKFNRKGNNPIGISWGTAPPINSLCRGDDQQAKMDFFMALVGEGDMDKGVSVAQKAHNEQSKIVKTIYEKIEPDLDQNHKVIVEYIDNEYKSFTGLIANKITGKFDKPSLVLREVNPTTFAGSLRSPIEIANEINKTNLAKCQGHLSACGIFLKKSNLNRLIKWFDTLPLDLRPEQKVTAILNPNQITLPLCHACSDDMILWGASKDHKVLQPKFYLEFETSPSDVQVFVKKTTTAKITKGDVAFLKFQASQDEVDKLTTANAKVSMVVTLGVNKWNGEESPQAIIDTLEIETIEEDGFHWEDLFE